MHVDGLVGLQALHDLLGELRVLLHHGMQLLARSSVEPAHRDPVENLALLAVRGSLIRALGLDGQGIRGTDKAQGKCGHSACCSSETSGWR